MLRRRKIAGRKGDKNMKILFISQPMKGKTDEEILAVREKAIKSAENMQGIVHRDREPMERQGFYRSQ